MQRNLARAVLAEHSGTFMLEPTIHEGEPVYLAHGKGGARGQNRSLETMIRFSAKLAA